MASVINQIKLGNIEYAIAASAYAECSTAAGTAAKVATICTDSDTSNTAFTLIKGVSVNVKFTNANTAVSPTLNINSTGAKSIRYINAALPAGLLKANQVYTFTYDGTYWNLVSSPMADGTTPGITVVYPAASCTTFSSDSGTVTPFAVQKGAKMFAITRPTSVANTVPRFTNTTGDIESTGIKIESVTNTKDSSKTAHVLSIPAEGGKKMVYGYCTDQTDGTSFIGGVFDASATTFPYASGLAIGGTSGNLLWKGKQVATTDMITDSDTKNTAGSTNSSSKLYLIGATSQAANPQTYSHDTAYVGTDGCLYSNNQKVATESYVDSKAASGGGTFATNYWVKQTYKYSATYMEDESTYLNVNDVLDNGSGSHYNFIILDETDASTADDFYDTNGIYTSSILETYTVSGTGTSTRYKNSAGASYTMSQFASLLDGYKFFGVDYTAGTNGGLPYTIFRNTPNSGAISYRTTDEYGDSVTEIYITTNNKVRCWNRISSTVGSNTTTIYKQDSAPGADATGVRYIKVGTPESLFPQVATMQSGVVRSTSSKTITITTSTIPQALTIIGPKYYETFILHTNTGNGSAGVAMAYYSTTANNPWGSSSSGTNLSTVAASPSLSVSNGIATYTFSIAVPESSKDYSYMITSYMK